MSGLSVEELEKGWVEFHCDKHGFLVAMTSKASVWCACGKMARRLRHGRLVDPDTLKPTQANARELNKAGKPYIYGCGDCGEDFHGKTLQKRHRVGSPRNKRCLTIEEMQKIGWHRDTMGRWRRPAPTSLPAEASTATPVQSEEGDSTV